MNLNISLLESNKFVCANSNTSTDFFSIDLKIQLAQPDFADTNLIQINQIEKCQ